MVLPLLVLLLALMFAGMGLAVHVFWIIAVMLLNGWLIGWGISHGERTRRRRWYGRMMTAADRIRLNARIRLNRGLT